MPAEGELSVSSCAIRALVVDLADIFQLGPKHLQAVKGVLKHYYPLLEAWDDTDLARALSTGGLADGIHTLLESGGVRVDSHLQDGDSNEESVENLTHSRSIKTIVTSVGEKMVDFMEDEPVRFDQAAVDILTRLKRELGCLVGAVWQSYGARALVQSAGLGELFDALVDGETQDAFGLRSYPAPDLLLKLCSNMAVSPYETVGVFSLQTGGVKAASSASFGLVVARPCPSEDVPSADLKKQTLRQAADVVVNNIRGVEASMLRRWYDCGIHEDAWNLVYTSYSPESELYRQALTCVSNGYMGTRGCFEGCRVTPNQRPGSYIAGVFNSTPQDDGTPPHALLVNVPNWCLIELKIGTEGFVNPLDEELLYYQHNLSFKDGLLERSITFRSDGDRETRVDVRRLLSMKQSHVGAVEYTVTPLNYDAPIVLRSAIDGDTPFGGLEILTTQEVHRETGILLTCRAAQSGVSVVTYARHRLHRRPAGDHPEDDFNHSAVVLREATSVAEEFIFNAQCNQSYTLEKLVSVWTSNDHAPEKASEGQTVAWLEHQAVREIRHTQRFKQVYEASRQAPTTLLPTGTPGLAPSLSSPPATMSSPTTKIAATCASPKVNAAWVREQLAAKADTDFVQRQGRNIDELFTLATGLSQTLERLAAHLAALTDGRSLDEAFELRVDNLTNEVVRLDKCKADRGELQLWLDRAATAASMTRTGYQCLSCNRVTGPIRTATRQKPPDFPPSTLALSALQPKGSPGTPGDLGSVRMLQRLTPTHPRKKLDQFYDWMQTRAEDDRLSHPHPHRGPTPNEARPPSPPSPGRGAAIVPPADGISAPEGGPTPREPDPDRLSRTQPDRPSRRTPLSIHGRGVG